MERNVKERNLRNVTSSVISLGNGDTNTNPYDIANTFNNQFASMTEFIRKKEKSIYMKIFLLKN